MHIEQIKLAAAEVLTQIENNTKPANEILNTYTRSRRYIGSKDRRTLSDIVWGVLRAYRRLEYDFPNATYAEKINAFLTGVYTSDYIPVNAPKAVCWEVPDWMPAHIDNPQKQLPPLLQLPQTILRANGNRDKIAQILSDEGIETIPTPLSPWGLILTKRCNLNESKAYKNGLIEIQDEGSQLVALETGIKSGDRVLDYCAGAGGKSLAFAQMMNNKGQIIAHDISTVSLSELNKRAKRARVNIITTKTPILPTNYPEKFDHVVVDAPCSGTGTWRRCPDARLKLTEKMLSDLIKKQAAILDTACRFVKKGGLLHYMTCSILRDENEDQVHIFLTRHPDFELIHTKQCSPANTGTDGLFIGTFKKTS